MSDQNNQRRELDNQRRELEEKILSKQQQIDFEKTNLNFEVQQDSENRENPDTAEESKNFNDPVENTVDSEELNALRKAERELTDLQHQLDDLGNT